MCAPFVFYACTFCPILSLDPFVSALERSLYLLEGWKKDNSSPPTEHLLASIHCWGVQTNHGKKSVPQRMPDILQKMRVFAAWRAICVFCSSPLSTAVLHRGIEFALEPEQQQPQQQQRMQQEAALFRPFGTLHELYPVQGVRVRQNKETRDGTQTELSAYLMYAIQSPISTTPIQASMLAPIATESINFDTTHEEEPFNGYRD